MPLAQPESLRRELAQALPERPFALRFWDGSELEPTVPGGPAFTVRSPAAVAHLLRAPGQLGLTLVSGLQSAQAHVRWVHSTELTDPTPWLKGGELLLTMGIQLDGPKAQRELIERLVDHEIAGLGFGTGFTHKRLPAALVLSLIHI